MLALASQAAEEKTCPDGDFITDKGVCCNKCSPGFKLAGECLAEGHRSNCTRCDPGEYMDKLNFSPNCRSCKRCKKNEVEVSKCERHQNTICRCIEGYYKYPINSDTYQCLRCSKCQLDERETHTCTPDKNTVCECKENYYRAKKNKCEPCKNCTDECKLPCLLPTFSTEVPDIIMGSTLMNLIGGVAVAFVVLLALVVVVTYFVTKRTTNKKLQGSSSRSCESSSDSCKVLIHSVELSNNNSVTAVPLSLVSEQEQPCSLPDCVPLEIKIPDLIYMVLDLVPVLRVKQLVRSLGVKDTEIEQAELDHRSCREAHYQMLRVWAERGTQPCGMLHRPLLQELLDELQKMHLGRAAEELETKYGIQ